MTFFSIPSLLSGDGEPEKVDMTPLALQAEGECGLIYNVLLKLCHLLQACQVIQR
jgi:hypothetical protein